VRSGNPDTDVAFFRNIQDRLRAVESRTVTQSRQATKEIRLQSAKRISSMMVIGDSISQFDRCNEFIDGYWTKVAPMQYRWQDRVADTLGGTTGVTRIVPDKIGPFSDISLVGTPVLVREGTGPFLQWDYSIPGASAQWWLDEIISKYAPPPEPVDLLCIMLGANDYWLGVEPSDYAYAYSTILNSYPHRYACLVIPWESSIVTSPMHPWVEYTDTIWAMANDTTVVVQPLVGQPTRDLAADGLHPTQAGHDSIATAVLDVLPTLDASPAQLSITASHLGVVVGEGIVIGNWRISVGAGGELVGTNLLTNQTTVLAS